MVVSLAAFPPVIFGRETPEPRAYGDRLLAYNITEIKQSMPVIDNGTHRTLKPSTHECFIVVSFDVVLLISLLYAIQASVKGTMFWLTLRRVVA